MTTNATNILLKKQNITCTQVSFFNGAWHAYVGGGDGTYGIGSGKTHSSAIRSAVRVLQRMRKHFLALDKK